jgi:hypothetical protein
MTYGHSSQMVTNGTNVPLAVTRVLLGRINVKDTLITRNGGTDSIICVFIRRWGE